MVHWEIMCCVRHLCVFILWACFFFVCSNHLSLFVSFALPMYLLNTYIFLLKIWCSRQWSQVNCGRERERDRGTRERAKTFPILLIRRLHEMRASVSLCTSESVIQYFGAWSWSQRMFWVSKYFLYKLITWNLVILLKGQIWIVVLYFRFAQVTVGKLATFEWNGFIYDYSRNGTF